MLNFVKKALKLGSIPVIILTNEINFMSEYEEILEALLVKCLFYTFESQTELFVIVDTIEDSKMKDLVKIYNKLFEKYADKHLKFVFPIEFLKMKNKIDCTRILGHLKGIETLTFDAMRIAERLLCYGVNSNWLLAFNTNPVDSYCETAISNIKFNNDIMINYLFYISKITNALGLSAMLYYIPTGLLNKNEHIDQTDTTCDYQDGSIFFLLGGTFISTNQFYKENHWNDKNLSINGDTVSIKPHTSLILKSGIRYILFGSKLPKEQQVFIRQIL